jgi:hypothetical protein
MEKKDSVIDSEESAKNLAKHILSAEQSSRDFVENFKDALSFSKQLNKAMEKAFDNISDNNKKIEKNKELLAKIGKGMESNLAKQATLEASINQHIQEQAKLSSDMGAAKEKKLDLSKQLLAIESDMEDVQMRAIHNEEDLSEEYGKMMQNREKILEAQKENNSEISSLLKLTRKLKNDEGEINKKIKERNELSDKYNKMVENKNKLESDNSGLESATNLLKSQVLLIKFIQLGYERFVKLDEAAESFRKETGFSNTQMIGLRKNVESINREFQDIGVGVDQAYASAKALTDVFGNTALVSKEAMTNVALMSANLGVVEADSANVLATFQGLGGATQEAAMNVMKVGAGLSEKAGVPFKLVMNDIANASEQTLSMLGANPSKLMKASIAARALGTSMNSIVSSQRKLLDFSSSINDELSASALLGKSISFQKARQLAYDGDIAGAAKATLDTVKKAGDFNKMSVYQREELAKASGMELKDLTKMLAVDAQKTKIRTSGTEEEKKKLKLQEDALKKLEEEADLSKQSLLDQNESAIRQQKMQGQMTQLKNIMESIMVSVGDILEPVIRVVSFILVPAFKIVSALIRGMLKPILNIGQALMGNADNTKKFAAFAEKVSAIMVTVYDWSEKIGEVIGEIYLGLNRVTGIARLLGSNFDAVASTAKLISSLAGKIGTNFGFLGKIFKPVATFIKFVATGISRVYNLFQPLISMASKFFGVASKGASFVGPFVKVFGMIAKFAGPIGLIINAVQVVVDLVGQWMDIWSSDDMDVGDKILKSILAIPNALFNVLISPFIDLGVWIARKFGADIPDDMVEGIKSVGREITQWLLMPWVKVFEWLKGTFLGNSPSEIGLMIVDGIKAIGGMLLDVIISPFKSGFEFVTSAFSYVVDSIKNVASDIFGFITSPFKKAMEFVKSIPLFGKLFGGNDIGAAAKPQVDNSTIENSSVIEVKNLDALRDVVQELTNAVANLATAAPAAAGATTAMNTSGIEAKLDTLTNLLTGGAVRVYLDGKDVSAAMTGIGR